jgi:hypothetical protein
MPKSITTLTKAALIKAYTCIAILTDFNGVSANVVEQNIAY